jgi:O-antigen/teichoic acid export membrane protein
VSAQSPTSLGRAGVLVGGASALANVFGFVFLALLSRAFVPSAYGEIAALLGIGAIGAVPAGAVQLLIARQLAARGPDPRVLSGRAVLGLGVVLVLAIMAVSPALKAALHIHATSSVLWLSLMLVPLTVAGGFQGHLLGAERFHAYAASLLLINAARLVAGGFALASRSGVASTMAVLALATAVATVVVGQVTDVGWWWRAERTEGWAQHVREFGVIVAGIGAFLVLSGLDLLLARHYLDPTASGVYAIGSLFTKAGLWGPQFVAILVFPRLSAGAGSGLVLRAAAAILLIGVLGTGVALAFGSRIVTAVSGPAYADAGRHAWIFAALGILLALVNLLLLGSLAEGRGWVSWAIWIAVVAEMGLVASVGGDSLRAVLLCATGVTTALVLVGLGRLLVRRRGAVADVERLRTA